MTVPTNRPALLVVDNIVSTCNGVRGTAQSWMASLQAGPVSADTIFSMMSGMHSTIGVLSTLRDTPGLDTAFTAAGYGGSLVSYLNTTLNAIGACLNWIFTNFPKAPTGEALAYTLNIDGSRTPRQFSTTDTAPLVTLLNAVFVSIG